MTRPPPRSTLFPYTTLSRPPTAAVACLRDGYRGVGQRRRAECAGLVCLELYPRELGGVTKMKSTVAIIGAGPAGFNRKRTHLKSSHPLNSYFLFFFLKKKKC